MNPTPTPNHNSNNNTNTNLNSSNSGRIGPRVKCDQVVYEAIAKAGEIIVRSRCDIPDHPPNRNNVTLRNSGHGSSSSTSNGSGSGSGSRFNIEVGEVESVR